MHYSACEVWVYGQLIGYETLPLHSIANRDLQSRIEETHLHLYSTEYGAKLLFSFPTGIHL